MSTYQRIQLLKRLIALLQELKKRRLQNETAPPGEVETQDVTVAKVEQCCLHEAPPLPEPHRIRAALFFDGTGNNRFNQLTKDTSHLTWADRKRGKDASYKGGETNISRGEKMLGAYIGVTKMFSIYIEGIGTRDGGSDNRRNMIDGKGITGVKAKVKKGIENLFDNLSILDKSRPIEFVHVDTFGFSRGAAAARYCCHAILDDTKLKLKSRLEAAGFEVGEVKIKFVGLYDTVSSHGLRHTNDVKHLELDAIKHAEHVIQLAAGDEHRANFQLTTIESAQGKSRQIFLPGVHSDIGGGYRSREDEIEWEVYDLDPNVLSSSFEADRAAVKRGRQWLIDMGWYADNEDEIALPNRWWEVKANRYGISNKYSHLPLKMMADEARDYGVNFRGQLMTFYPIPNDAIVEHARQMIDESIATGNTTKGDASARIWLHNNDPRLRKLRHKYCHMSSRYNGVGNAPNFATSAQANDRRRGIISDASR